MNREWMLERLTQLKGIVESYEREAAKSAGYSDQQRMLNDEASRHMPTARRILKLLDSELAERLRPLHYMGSSAEWLDAVQQGIGILQDMDEWSKNLLPDAPSIPADQLHPHVWAAAAALWDTGQYRVAVGQAATSLSAHIAKKSESSLSDRKLVAQVFSPKHPEPGQVRLHRPGDRMSETWKSQQDGLHLLAQGVFAGIRNTAAHTDDQWPEHVALEHLAALSVVARWADDTEVVRDS